MANNFALITKFLPKIVDTIFAAESKSAVLVNGEKFIDLNFQEAGYVKILEILTDGLSNYYRGNSNAANGGYSNYNGVGHNDGYQVGNAQTKWEIHQLRYDRGRQFQIDEADNEETAGAITANLLTEFLRVHVVPEVDLVRFGTIADKTFTSLGNRVTETPNTTKGNASEITHLFNNAFQWLIEHGVPEEDQVIFVSPAVWTTIANTEEIYKKLTQAEYKSEQGITFNFSAYYGRPIIVVPSDRFYSHPKIGANGYGPNSNSYLINYIVCSKRAVVPVVKIEKSRVFGPEVNQDFDGYKINFRLYHDVIIPKNKVLGCYVSLSSALASTKSGLLSVATEADGNDYKLIAYYTTPAGKLGRVIHGASAFTLGATATAQELATVIAEGDTFSSSGTEYFALVDGSNTIVAVSGAVTL